MGGTGTVWTGKGGEWVDGVRCLVTLAMLVSSWEQLRGGRLCHQGALRCFPFCFLSCSLLSVRVTSGSYQWGEDLLA